MKKLAAAALFAAALASGSAHAQSAFNGFHAGASVGPVMGSAEIGGAGNKFDQAFRGFVGGGSVGYGWGFADGWILDVEAMVDYSQASGDLGGGAKIKQGPLGYGVAGSIGYLVTRNNEIYGKIGYEMRDFKLTGFGADESKSVGGVVFGGGSKWALDGNWSVKAEYLYGWYQDANFTGLKVSPTSSTVKVGFDYRFW